MFAQRIYETGRRDLDWFLSPDTVLLTRDKISQVVTISKWTGHRTSLGDLKEARGLSRETSCNDELINTLCDCPKTAAYDEEEETQRTFVLVTIVGELPQVFP